MSLDPLERLILEEEVDCDSIDAKSWHDMFTDPDVLRELGREGIDPPTLQAFLAILGRLVEKGYLTLRATREASTIRPEGDSEALTDAESLWFSLTDEGRAEARKSLVLRRIEMAEERLGFAAILPSYLPQDVSPLPVMSLDGENGYVQAVYYALPMSPYRGARVIITEGRGALRASTGIVPPRNHSKEEATRHELMASTRIAVSEYYLTTNWPVMEVNWRADLISFRAWFLWSAPGKVHQAIDDEMRVEARRVVMSMISSLSESTLNS